MLAYGTMFRRVYSGGHVMVVAHREAGRVTCVVLDGPISLHSREGTLLARYRTGAIVSFWEMLLADGDEFEMVK